MSARELLAALLSSTSLVTKEEPALPESANVAPDGPLPPLLCPETGEEFSVEIRTESAGTIWLVNRRTGRYPRELTPADIEDLSRVMSAHRKVFPGAPHRFLNIEFETDGRPSLQLISGGQDDREGNK